MSVEASDKDRKAALEVLRNAQFVFGLSRYPKKQVLDDPNDVKALRERLESMREAARALSAARRDALAVPLQDLEAIDSGTEAVWKAAKSATPKIIAELAALVRDEPEAAFLIAPTTRGRKAELEREEPKPKEQPKEKPDTGLSGKELAGLELVVQARLASDEAYHSWLRGNHSLPLPEWRRRRAEADKARREEEHYIERLLRSRAGKTP